MKIKEITDLTSPFTRLDWPEGILVVKHVKPENPGVDMIYTNDLNSAKQLRTELIKSVELLDFYIRQIEDDGEMKYFR